jgi:hypothetical protein
MSKLLYFIESIDINYKLLNDISIKKIKNKIKEFLPNLNEKDIFILTSLVLYLIDVISYKNSFDEKYITHIWIDNNMNIISCTLILLPYINSNGGIAYKELKDLNQILYYYIDSSIPSNIINKDRNILVKDHFRYSTLSISFISEEGLLLEFDNNKLIYDIIYCNISSVLKTIEIMNGKLFINWIQIIPITMHNYHTKSIYTNTNNILSLLPIEEPIEELIEK